MLQSLKINNIALIDELTINFKDKLNVLTGETGAGKSIIIDSLTFLLGGRADKTLIRTGMQEARVTGVFSVDIKKNHVLEFFNKVGLKNEDTVIITREMSLNGKSITKVNGEFVTVNMLKKFTSYLIDIHGQNEHQFLLEQKNQLTILDSYGAEEIDSLKKIYFKNYEDLRQVNQHIKALGGSEEERLREIDLLDYQVNEIESAEITQKEEEELIEKLKMMQNAERIASAVTSANTYLDSGYSSGGIISQLNSGVNSLSSISIYDKNIDELVNRLASAKLELEDVVDELNKIATNLDFNEQEFEQVDERLDYIKKLKRKYGGSVDSMLEYLDEAKNKLFNLKNSNDQLEKLNKEKQDVLKSLLKSAQELSDKRHSVAKQLSDSILNELKDLGMQNSSLVMQFNKQPTIEEVENFASKDGIDQVEFMFSANLGEPVKPLTKIISGGEMSRFMLALKTIIAKTDNIPTMIFDEIDTGISGKMAQAVSYKMAKISKNHQVLVVSHLPQIAAMADAHFYIEKHSANNQTKTNVKQIENQILIEEIARMLSGQQLTEASINNAKELKKSCNKFKQMVT